MSVRHVVWDWNGTLFDDYEAVVSAWNESMLAFEVAPVTADELREIFYRPLEDCYAEVLGRPLVESEWVRVNDDFRDAYDKYAVSCTLTKGAVELMGTIRESGKTQSLLSMFRHDRLHLKIAEFGIAELFTRIDGRPDLIDGTGKTRHLIKHLAVQEIEPADVVVIGDTADDGDAARAVGAQAVLYDQGSDSVAALKATGFPVVSTLAEAMEQVLR